MDGVRSAVSGTSEKLTGTSDRFCRRVYQATGLQEVFNDSNVNLVLKSSREKTVPALSPLAVKEGQVVKLNDSGAWRRRHALVVPHTFLYYFGESSASTDLRPHGVIDLELYTDVKVVDGNVVRLAPLDTYSPIRTFYLRLPNREEAEAWAQSLREARFDGVREERDALRSAKDVLTEQLLMVTEIVRTSEASLKASQRREAAAVSGLARSDEKEARRVEQVQALLASARDADGGCQSHGDGFRRHSAGVVESARGCNTGGGAAACALSEMAALGEAIAERAREVAELKAANESLLEEAATAAERRKRDAAIAISSLNEERERFASERGIREGLERELDTLRLELEANRAAKEEARANLGAVAAACREAEAKARELQDHRRVLAREVKASRAEQRRLSAALACATTVAATAAATVAANAESANGRDPSSSSWVVAGNGAQQELDAQRGGEEGAQQVVEVSAGADGDEVRRSAHDSECRKKPPRGVVKRGIDKYGATDMSDGSIPQERAVEGDAVPPTLDNIDAPVSSCNLGTIVATSTPLRPTPLDVRSTSSRDTEHTMGGGAESGATSPEVFSPAATESADGVQSASQWQPSAFAEPILGSNTMTGPRTSVTEDNPECAPIGGESLGVSGPRGMPETTEADDEEGERARSLNLGAAKVVGLVEEDGASSAPAPTSASASAAAAAVVGESLNGMVQSFSAALGETRKAKRTPLLGSLDDNDADDGGVTDGTDGDSGHDSRREEGERNLLAVWSTLGRSGHRAICEKEGSLLDEGGSEVKEPANSTMHVFLPSVGEPENLPLVACGSPFSYERRKWPDPQQGPLKDAAYSQVSTQDTTVATSVMEPIVLSATRCLPDGSAKTSPPAVAISRLGSPDIAHAISDPLVSTAAALPGVAVAVATRAPDTPSPLSSSLGGWRDSLEAAAEAAGTSADWIRKVARRNGEETAWEDACSSTPAPSRALEAGDTVPPKGGAEGGSVVALATVAAAAAEQGGRVSLEAAAAARRWEAKFKGSIISMTGGVRWGMGS